MFCIVSLPPLDAWCYVFWLLGELVVSGACESRTSQLDLFLCSGFVLLLLYNSDVTLSPGPLCMSSALQPVRHLYVRSAVCLCEGSPVCLLWELSRWTLISERRKLHTVTSGCVFLAGYVSSCVLLQSHCDCSTVNKLKKARPLRPSVLRLRCQTQPVCTCERRRGSALNVPPRCFNKGTGLYLSRRHEHGASRPS